MTKSSLLLVGAMLAVLAAPRRAAAHCDTTTGPVVTAARVALDRGDPNLVLYWVQPDDEPAVRAAFAQTLAVRALGPEAKALADRYFFETLVRLHRAGEGAPYTGLSDEAPEPIIALTDRALADGSAAELERTLVAAVEDGLAARFAAASAARRFQPGDVAGGRRFVAAYVPLAHWVEGVLGAAEAEGEHHGAVAPAGPAGHRPAGEPAVGDEPHDPSAPEQAHPREHASGHGSHLGWGVAAGFGLSTLVLAVLLARRRRATPAA